jgi:hypothetical protein
MQNTFSNALSEAVSKHIALSPTRRETLAWLALLIMRHGTICLWRLAAHVATAATTDSAPRRFYRFFQHVELDGAMTARVVVDLLGMRGRPWVLAMDRTNWEFGKTTINILRVSAIWNGKFMFLGRSADLDAAALDRQLQHQGADRPARSSACGLSRSENSLAHGRSRIRRRRLDGLAAREENPFRSAVSREPACRAQGLRHIAGDLSQQRDRTWTIAEIARGLGKGEKTIVKGWQRLGQAAGERSPQEKPHLRIVVMRLPTGELLALACSGNPRHALAAYRQRWTIETLFANLKTKGFNLEAAHITAPEKLSTLLAVPALTVTLCVKTGVAAARLRPIPIKKHGRRAWSLFALGLATLRKIAASAKPPQVIAFLRELLSPKLPVNQLKSMAV